jgi:cysteine desulfurase
MMRAYLDHNATTPIDPRVQALQTATAEGFPGNPSSLHREGREARRQLEDARARIAELVGAEPREIVFTGSATEAANTAIFGLAAGRPERRRVLASPIEHPCILEPLERLSKQGFDIEWMKTGADGLIDVAAAGERCDSDLAFVVLMQVNNETGVIQDVASLLAQTRAIGVPLVVDRVQAPGKLADDPRLRDANISFFSPHKFQGPRGIGIMVVRGEMSPQALVIGGGQERERRAGTENVAAAVAAARAFELAVDEIDARRERRQAREEQLLEGLRAADINYALNAAAAPRVPGVLNLRFPGHYGETLLMNLDLRGVAVSLGSACSSGSIEPSHVLRAMGLGLEENFSSLRVSLSHTTRAEEIDTFVRAMSEITAAAED